MTTRTLARSPAPRGVPYAGLVLAALLALAACAPSTRVSTLPSARDDGVAAAVAPGAARVLPGLTEVGMASWYGPGFAGRSTANGEVFDPSLLTAAHQTLPFDTRVRVTNLSNGRVIEVRINDRGPFKANRIIDLSRAAAEQIGLVGSGVGRVRIEVVSGAPGAARLAGGASVTGYQALSIRHAPGQLLVLRSSRSPDPVLVRVVSGTFPVEANADLVVADALFLALGPDVDVAMD
jgi:rare lipoprotein A